MLPHERSLVAKLKDAPFTLLGVNSDSEEALRAALAREPLPWRSFFDGGSTDGPIATQWNVRAWPSLWILDADGVIRARDLRGEALARKVEELLAELRRRPAPDAAR